MVMDGSINAWLQGCLLVNIEVILSKDVKGCEVLGKGTVSEAVPQVRMPTGFIPKSRAFIATIAELSDNL